MLFLLPVFAPGVVKTKLQQQQQLIGYVTGGGKSGGGFQGREVKSKSTKKKYLGRDKDEADSDHDDASAQNDNATVFMSCTEVADELRHQSSLVDCSPEFTDAIASYLYR